MKKFNIIISKLNIYTGQVKKIKNESRLPIEVMYIEDILNKNESLINFENSIIYFLCCNSILSPLAIQKLEKYNPEDIFNKKNNNTIICTLYGR